MASVAYLARKTIREPASAQIKYEFTLPNTLMGVEIEVDRDRNTPDTVYPPDSRVSFWRKHHDGSLMNGYEYTLNMPMAGDMLSVAIGQFMSAPTQVYRTFTGSTHIHMDMLEEEVTLDVLRTLVLLVYVLEPMLYAAGDASREWCGYANSLKSAEPLLLSTLFSEDVDRSFHQTYRRGGALGRYYGLNLAALTDYGSVEFRYFPTATSADELVRWINLVQSFKKAALDIGNVDVLKNIINEEASFQSMMDTYFGAYRAEAEAIGGWRKVHAYFVKAGIVSKDSQLITLGRFEGNSVFTEGRFSNLVTLRDMSQPPVLPEGETVVIHNNGNVPTGAIGDILIYNRRAYFHTRVHGWTSVSDTGFMDVAVPQRALCGLYEVRNSAVDIIERDVEAIESILAVGNMTQVGRYVESHDDEPHPEEDYDEEDDGEDY